MRVWPKSSLNLLLLLLLSHPHGFFCERKYRNIFFARFFTHVLGASIVLSLSAVGYDTSTSFVGSFEIPVGDLKRGIPLRSKFLFEDGTQVEVGLQAINFGELGTKKK